MTRPGPLSAVSQALGAFNLLLLAVRIPAMMFGLGWVPAALALVAAPLAMCVAVIARQREADEPSRRAVRRAVSWSGGSLALQLLWMLVLGP